MSLILSIEEAKEKGMTTLVAQLERDLERRQLLKMPPLEEVKEKDEKMVWEESPGRLGLTGPPFRLNWTHNPLQ